MAEVIAIKANGGTGRTVEYKGVRYAGGRRYDTGRGYDFDYVRNGRTGAGFDRNESGGSAISNSQRLRTGLQRSSSAAARRQNPRNNPVLAVQRRLRNR